MTAAQTDALNQHWQSYGLELQDGLIDASRVFKRSAPLTVEIGFGMGDSLLEMAERMPERNFIGIEVHTPGVGRLLAGIDEKQLANLKVYRADAVQVLEHCFANNSIERVQVFFPDPWHKKRHHKRRLIQSSFLDLLEKKVLNGGTLHIATDWENYAEQCLELLESRPAWSNCCGEGQYAPRPDNRPHTKFERRGERLGHGVWDLLFQTNVDTTSSR